jgi:hypothetical protein
MRRGQGHERKVSGITRVVSGILRCGRYARTIYLYFQEMPDRFTQVRSDRLAEGTDNTREYRWLCFLFFHYVGTDPLVAALKGESGFKK